MNFEVGKLYITENNEHTDGCVFEYVGCGENVSILKFNIIKTNAYFQCKDFRIERRNVDTFGFKPLFATIDDVFECEGCGIKEYLFDKILHPNPNEKKLKPTPEAKKIVEKLKDKINNELMTMHKPLKFMEEHNKSINILYKNFYNESVTEEENYNAYLELCKHLSEQFPHITPPSFKEWLKNPQTIYGMCEESMSDELRNYRENLDNTIQYEPSKVEILEEIILCLLKKLDISIDIEGIKHCLAVTSYMDTFNTESIENTQINKDMVNSFLRLQDHDFIIKNNKSY